MVNLNKDLIMSDFSLPEGLEVNPYPDQLPERVIQFGEGNFLRAFVDWMFHKMNARGLFNGRIVVVQPLSGGLVPILNEQDGLYTLILRGLRNGEAVCEEQIISSISRGLNIYKDWQDYLKCAENPIIEFVISNTTEAGITYNSTDRPEDKPPTSFPAKLAVYLYHRFRHFEGDPQKGMVIIPCELIDRNGDNLKSIILRLIKEWGWPQEFHNWVEHHNQFLNTLVDRVVPGYPKDEVDALTAHLGFEDKLLDTGELFHLWVIEGPKELQQRLPFTEIGLNVVWTDDMTPYRTQKVRILNGAHTSCVPVAFLYGLNTVGEMVDHPILGRYTREVIFNEIIPSVKFDKKILNEFANAVLERFQNPYIKHYLLSILLNSTSKFKTRVLPSLLGYFQKTGLLPLKLSFSLASLLALYQGTVEESAMLCQRNEESFLMQDDRAVLELMQEAWSAYDGSLASVMVLVRQVLSHSEIWGQNLCEVTGLTEKVAFDLYTILHEGIDKAIASTFIPLVGK